jgi:hypothetical protein
MQRVSRNALVLGVVTVAGALLLAVVLPGSTLGYVIHPAVGTSLVSSGLVTAAPTTWNTGGACNLIQNGGAPNGTVSTGFVSFDVHADALANCTEGSQSTYAGFIFNFSCQPTTCPVHSPHTFTITVNWTASWFIWTRAVTGTSSSSVATVFLYSALSGRGTGCGGSGSSEVTIDTHSLTAGNYTHAVSNATEATIYAGSVSAGCTGFSVVTYLAGTTHAIGGPSGGAYAETDLRYFGPDYLNFVTVR